jgi:hypothetical protein
MSTNHLANTVAAFNMRDYEHAIASSSEGLATAQGRDEAFWMGLNEACEGFALLDEGKWFPAERKLVASMQKLRNFGFRYNNFEVTVALAGIRLSVEEIKAVRNKNKRVFDVTLLPQFRLAAKADD